MKKSLYYFVRNWIQLTWDMHYNCSAHARVDAERARATADLWSTPPKYLRF